MSRPRVPADPGRIQWSFDIYEWIAELRPGQWVLDVASGPGSFPNPSFRCSVVALDEDVNAFGTAAALPEGPYYRVFGRSDGIPFANGSFDLIICHHALEHVVPLDETLREIARVLKANGRLYVAVPNGKSLCDAVYRFVFEGGGHVNRFSREELVQRVENTVGLRLARWQKLYSSFVYLRRLMELIECPPPGLSRRLLVIARLPRRALSVAQWLLYLATRAADRLFHTDSAVYGWALYFERSAGPAREEPAYANVCLYCGAGHHAESVERPRWFCYRCNVCNRMNPYFRPFGNTR